MQNTYHGVAVNFGLAAGITSIVGQFQTNDHGYTSDTEVIRDGTGAEVEKTFYAFKQTATFDYVASAAGGPSGTATVTVNAVGAIATVTDANYPAIAGTNWLVDSVDVKRSNVAAVRVTVKMTQYPSIVS
jgi:hypothetical protein